MRKAISRFTSSFAALLTDQTTVIDADGRTENIRTAMLQALSEVDGSPATAGHDYRNVSRHRAQKPDTRCQTQGRFSISCAGL
jgi:hypothetical protein